MLFRLIITGFLTIWLNTVISGGLVWAAPWRVGVDRITFESHQPFPANVFVSVIDTKHRPVMGLQAVNFGLTENDQSFTGNLEAVPFVSTERDLVYLLLAENSDQTATSLTLVRQSLLVFLAEMGFRYHGAVGVYTHQPEIKIGPTTNTARLAAGVSSLKPQPARLNLYDGLFLGVQELMNLRSENEFSWDRQAIVILTDGRDEGSLYSWAAARTRLWESGVTLFVVGYGREDSAGLTALNDLAELTGGGGYFAAVPDELPNLLQLVADRLKYQYVLTFSPSLIQPDGNTYRLQVTVKDGGLQSSGEIEFQSPRLARKPSGLLFIFAAGLAVALSWLVFRIKSRAGENRPARQKEL